MELTLRVPSPGEFSSLDELETFVQELGQRLKRQLFRTLAPRVQHPQPRCPQCQSPHLIRKGERSRQFKTLFGKVTIANPRFRCRGCKRYCAQLNQLHARQITEALRQVIIYCGMSWSFAAAARMIDKLTGVRVSPKQIQLMTEEEGCQVAEGEQEQAQQRLEQQQEWVAQRVDQLLEKEPDSTPKQQSSVPEQNPARLYIQLDGVHVHGHPCQWENSLEGKIGVIFSEACQVRGRRKRLLDRQYQASFAGRDALAQKVYARALEQGLENKEVVILGDGAPWIANVQRKYFTHAKFILDWWHLKKYVWEHVTAQSGKDQQKKQEQARAWINQLWEGEVKAVLDQLGEDSPAALRELKDFLHSNRKAIVNYEQYREQGYYISSSMVEKAADLVVGRRQKHQGMGWTRRGAEAVAVLRTVFLNGQWEEHSNMQSQWN